MNTSLTDTRLDREPFDIRDHLDKLTPAKGKNRYDCPVCDGNNLTIDPNSGKYKCWNGCDCKGIREMIAPWDEVKAGGKSDRIIPRKPKSKPTPKPALVPEGEVRLARLPGYVEIPQKRKIGDRFQTTYPYSESQWIQRIDLPDGKKEIRPWHIDAEGNEKIGKGDSPWPAYRILEVLLHAAGQWALCVEGEKCVDVARQTGLSAFTLQGSAWIEAEMLKVAIALKEAGVAGIAFFPDRDDTGDKKAENMALAAAKAQLPFILLDPALIWAECPIKGDIADWVECMEKQGWDKEEFVRKLEEQFQAAAEREPLRQDTENDVWDDTDDTEEKAKAKLPGQDKIAFQLAEQYRPELAWHSGIKSWFRYGIFEGIWAEATDESIKRAIATHLYSLPDNPDFSANYVDGVVKLLKAQLEVVSWDEQRGLIPLQDGVLNASTLELLSHAPGYRFLWQLPYKWSDRTLGCQPIQEWMSQVAEGDQQVIQLLRAYLKAVVMGRVDLQALLELIGVGGSGKGTYSRLAQALVGTENTGVTTLKQLEENRFETAGLFGKRLLLITDSEKYGGDVSTLKAITGGDAIRYEKKNVQQCKPYTPTYMVIISANEPIQSTDYTSGLARRRKTVPFNLQVADGERRDLDSEFKPYLAGCLEWVLLLPDAEMEDLIRNTSESVFAAKNWRIEALLDTNPLADWFDSHCCIVPGTKTYVGGLNDQAAHKLYPSYVAYMNNAGCKPVAMRRFSKLLVDLASAQLGYKSVRKLPKNEHGVAIADVILRDHTCIGYARPITGNRDNPPNPPNNGGGSNHPKKPIAPNNPSDGSLPVKSDILPVNLPDETLAADGFDGSDGFFESGLKTEISEQVENSTSDQSPLNEACDKFNPSESSATNQPQSGQGFEPSVASVSLPSVYRQPEPRALTAVVEAPSPVSTLEATADQGLQPVTEVVETLVTEEAEPTLTFEEEVAAIAPKTEQKTERKTITLGAGEGVGHIVRTRNLKGELSTELFEIVDWNEPNGFYTLSNGDTAYPCNLRLAE